MTVQDRLRELLLERAEKEPVARKERASDAARKRLLRICQKKITTSFIGALAKVESHIGSELWGHGRPVSECTDEQLDWRVVWEMCRTEILNNGNNQLRGMEAELAQHTVEWNRYFNLIPASGA